MGATVTSISLPVVAQTAGEGTKMGATMVNI